MSIETRNFETRYFEIDGALLIGVECVRGKFGEYDGFFETLSVTWWLESRSDRKAITHAEIKDLIRGRKEIESAGLANYFADADDLGDVISAGYTSNIDFRKSFGREQREMFPRVEHDILRFTSSKCFGEPIASEVEFYDFKINLQTMHIEKTMFWSGDLAELVRSQEPPNDG